MTRLRTHYSELQVVEDASPEAIKGAYKHLAQKWHPDRHPNRRAEAEEITSRLNVAYDTLIDPDKRRAHDRWIAQQRQEGATSRPERQQRGPVRRRDQLDPEALRESPIWKPAGPEFRQRTPEEITDGPNREKAVRFLSWWDNGNSIPADIFFGLFVAAVLYNWAHREGVRISFLSLVVALAVFCYLKNRPKAKRVRPKFEAMADRPLETRYIKVKHRLQLWAVAWGAAAGVFGFLSWWGSTLPPP